MLLHSAISTIDFKRLVKKGEIVLAGNRQLKIYGTLHCSSGKRMKISNRVFFQSEKEALTMEYRPCGHCMKIAYSKWKQANNKQA